MTSNYTQLEAEFLVTFYFFLLISVQDLDIYIRKIVNGIVAVNVSMKCYLYYGLMISSAVFGVTGKAK